MGPVHSNVGYFVAPTSEIVSVVGSRMALMLVGVIVSQYIFALLVSGVIRVANCSSILPRAYSPDLKVLDDIENDVIVTENVPGNLASFQRR